ncbi:MAG: hypothetical protein ACOCRO_03500 [Halanaerobiales bacterium]
MSKEIIMDYEKVKSESKGKSKIAATSSILRSGSIYTRDGGILTKILDFIKFIVNIILGNNNNLNSSDASNIERIIKEGKNKKVKKMTIKVSKETVLGADLVRKIKDMNDKFGNINANLGKKSETEYEIYVEYK